MKSVFSDITLNVCQIFLKFFAGVIWRVVELIDSGTVRMNVRLLALRNCVVQPNFTERRKWKFALNPIFLFRCVQNSSLEVSRMMYWFFTSFMKVGVWRPYDVIGHCIFSLVRTNWGTNMCPKLKIPYTNKELRFTSQNTTSIMDIYFIFGDKATTCFGLYHQAIIRSQVNNRTWGS